MKLSLIIPTYKRPDFIYRICANLKDVFQSGPVSFEFETFVVFNSPEPRSEKKLLNSFKNSINLQTLCAKKRGVNRARNLGLKHASGDLILFLDDDCLIADLNYFNKALFEFINNKREIFGGGYTIKGNLGSATIAYQIISEDWQNNLDQSHRLLGGNLFIKRSILNNNIKFNNEITFGASETEFIENQRAFGTDVHFIDDLDVIHAPSISVADIAHKAYMQGKNSKEFVKKHSSLNLENKYYITWTPLLFKYCPSLSKFNRVYALIQLYIFCYENSHEALGPLKANLKYLTLLTKLNFIDKYQWNYNVFKASKSSIK